MHSVSRASLVAGALCFLLLFDTMCAFDASPDPSDPPQPVVVRSSPRLDALLAEARVAAAGNPEALAALDQFEAVPHEIIEVTDIDPISGADIEPIFISARGDVILQDRGWTDWYAGVITLGAIIRSSLDQMPDTVSVESVLVASWKVEIAAVDRRTNGALTRMVTTALQTHDGLEKVESIGWWIPKDEAFYRSVWGDEPVGPDERASRLGLTLTAVILAQCRTPDEEAAAAMWLRNDYE